jgi:hypothetical protein
MHTEQQVQQVDTAERDRKDEEQQEQLVQKEKKKRSHRSSFQRNEKKKRKRQRLTLKGEEVAQPKVENAKLEQQRESKREDIVQLKDEEVAQLKAKNANLNIELGATRSDLDWANKKEQRLKMELEEKTYAGRGLCKSYEDLKYANHASTEQTTKALGGWRRERAAWRRERTKLVGFGISMTNQLIQAKKEQRTEEEQLQRRWDGVEE